MAHFDDREVLITKYDDGTYTVAMRTKAWESWGPPAPVEWEPEHDYRTDRRIEDVVIEGLLGERG